MSYELIKYYCNTGNQPYEMVESYSPELAAMEYAEYNELDSGEVVHVKRHGRYKIEVITEPEYYATKIK